MSEVAAGTIIGGRYRIRRLLGRGGMGLVYEAEHTSLGRLVALKMLVPDAAQDAPAVMRFFQEARAAAAIGHPGIVEIFDLSQPGEAPFLAMEKLEGEELSRFVARAHPIPVGTVVALAIELCEAVGAAHKNGIVHRDLKPDNVFLAQRGDRQQVKVLDFGIAKLMQKSDVALTQTGQVVGTPLYMSPEQMRNVNVSARSDVYSIGAILYECLAGRPPFDGENITEIIVKVTSDVPMPMRNLRSDVPLQLDALLGACLEKDPARRPADANALAAMLKQVQQGVATPPPMYGLMSPMTPPPMAFAPTSPRVPTDPMPVATGPFGASPGYTPPPVNYSPAPVNYAPAYAPPAPARSSGMGLGCLIAAGVGVLALAGLVVLGAGAIFALSGKDEVEDPSVPDGPIGGPRIVIGRREPSEPPPPPPPRAEHEILFDKVGPLIQDCLNRYAERAAQSQQRYYMWCDRETGPTGSERHIYGLYPLVDETGEACTRAVSASNGLPPEDPELEAAATRFANAISALAPTLGAAERYYERESYRDDGMARGRELHAQLVPQFDEAVAASEALRPLVRAIETRARAASVEALARDPAQRTEYLRQHFLQQAQLVATMMEELRLEDGVLVANDQTMFVSAVEELQRRAEEIRGHTPTDRSSWSSYADDCDELVTKALQTMRAVRDRTRFDGHEQRMMGTSAGWMVDNSPDAYVWSYNRFVTFNRRFR